VNIKQYKLYVLLKFVLTALVTTFDSAGLPIVIVEDRSPRQDNQMCISAFKIC